ncbi:MAG: tetratricopeptide repeat protein [Bradymonadales bacterium]|nr:tetratricopeptide repeat protein [Bradymonadales bacterium]
MQGKREKLLLGKYKLLERLGVGGVGEVYRARQYPLERPVALKLLKPELGKNPTIRRRFAREAKAVASLNHPNIITIYDFGVTEDESLYLAMEFIDGQSLRTLIEKGMPTIPALIIMDQVMAGLAHAHARGLVHRDLKPENILVSRIDHQLHAKIVDFGIASLVDRIDEDLKEVHAKGKVVGTPGYMSPEQARGEQTLNHKTDIYNLGIIFYEIATGRHPFNAKTPQAMMLAHCNAPVPRLLARPGFLLPDKLEAIILKCLAKEPVERFANTTDLRAAVAEVRRSMEDRGHALYLPISPALGSEIQGRITLVEGTPRIISAGPSAVSHALDLPCIGQEEEKQFLIERAEEVCKERRGALVTLEGEAGLGKTRLATWLKERVGADGTMRSLTGRYLHDVPGSLRGIRDALEQLLGTRELNPAQVSTRVASQLLSWEITDAHDAGLLIQLLRSPDRNEGESAHIEVDDEELFTIVCRVLRAAGAIQPLLIILDDLQWCGPQTCHFLSFFAAEARSAKIPALLIGTLRSEDLPDNPALIALVSKLAVYEQDIVVRRRLNRMRPEEMQHLIGLILPAHESLATAIIRRAEGNPLFALQLLRHLIDEDLVMATPTGSYLAAKDVRIDELVPPNLADLLVLRLTQLERRYPDKPLLPLLERAAVLGTRFPYETLAHIVAAEQLVPAADLDGLLDILLVEGLLTQRPDRGEDLLDFNHTLIRDVLLARLAPRRTTRRLHLLAAEAKKKFFADREERVAQQLSVHYELGHAFDEAVKYAQLAGLVAERDYRPAEAVTCWKRYLRLIARLSEEQQSQLPPLTVEEAQVRLGEHQEETGLYDEAEATFRKLVPQDDTPLQGPFLVRAALGLASIALNQGRAFQAESLFEAAREAADQLDSAMLLSRSYLGLANVSWHHGHAIEALDQVRTAFDEAVRADDQPGQANVLWFTGDVLRLIGELEQSERTFRQALEIFQRLADPRGIARCLYGLALVARSADELDQAEKLYTEAYQVLEPIAVRKALGHCLNGLGEVARFRNRLGEASDYYRRAVEIFQRAGLPTDAAVSLTNLGLVARDSGDLEGARDAMERALKVAEAASYRYLTLGIAFNLSWVYALLGDRKRCSRMLEDHLDKALRYGLVDPDFARPLEGIAEVLDAAGETKEARRLYERARDMWEELKRDQDASRVALLLR